MGVDVAVLDETLQKTIKETEGVNEKLLTIMNFVMELTQRLDQIDQRARDLSNKWFVSNFISLKIIMYIFLLIMTLWLFLQISCFYGRKKHIKFDVNII